MSHPNPKGDTKAGAHVEPKDGRFQKSSEQGVNEPLRLVHYHPGYLRARANVFLKAKQDCAVVVAARTAAETTAGFRGWAHNPETGSIVIQYQPGAVDADDLLKHIAKRAGLSGVKSDVITDMHREELVNAFMDRVQELNRVVWRATGGRADLRELVPAALVVTSAISFVLHDERGRLPRWDGAFYHAYRIFWNWHRGEISDRVKGGQKKEREEANSGI